MLEITDLSEDKPEGPEGNVNDQKQDGTKNNQNRNVGKKPKPVVPHVEKPMTPNRKAPVESALDNTGNPAPEPRKHQTTNTSKNVPESGGNTSISHQTKQININRHHHKSIIGFKSTVKDIYKGLEVIAFELGANPKLYVTSHMEIIYNTYDKLSINIPGGESQKAKEIIITDKNNIEKKCLTLFDAIDYLKEILLSN